MTYTWQVHNRTQIHDQSITDNQAPTCNRVWYLLLHVSGKLATALGAAAGAGSCFRPMDQQSTRKEKKRKGIGEVNPPHDQSVCSTKTNIKHANDCRALLH